MTMTHAFALKALRLICQLSSLMNRINLTNKKCSLLQKYTSPLNCIRYYNVVLKHDILNKEDFKTNYEMLKTRFGS